MVKTLTTLDHLLKDGGRQSKSSIVQSVIVKLEWLN